MDDDRTLVGQLVAQTGDPRIQRALRARTIGLEPGASCGPAAFDETLRVAIVNPQWDGFLVTMLAAFSTVEQLRVAPDESLQPYVTAHHLEGRLRRGQIRPIDLELHPAALPRRGVRGWIHAHDGADQLAGVSLEIVLLPSTRVTCSIAGAVEGPLAPAALDREVSLVRRGPVPAGLLARRIERAASRRSFTPGAPWWSLPGDDG